MLRASFTSTEAEQPSIETVSMDLSAYVDPLNGKVLKINKVTFVVDDGSGEALPVASFTPITTAAAGGCWTAQLATGTQTSMKGVNDNRNIATKFTYVALVTRNKEDGIVQAATFTESAGTIWSFEEFTVPEMGYYVAADTLTFMAQHQLDLQSSIRHTVVIEAEKIKLPAADVNFLLVNQTITT